MKVPFIVLISFAKNRPCHENFTRGQTIAREKSFFFSKIALAVLHPGAFFWPGSINNFCDDYIYRLSIFFDILYFLSLYCSCL